MTAPIDSTTNNTGPVDAVPATKPLTEGQQKDKAEFDRLYSAEVSDTSLQPQTRDSAAEQDETLLTIEEQKVIDRAKFILSIDMLSDLGNGFVDGFRASRGDPIRVLKFLEELASFGDNAEVGGDFNGENAYENAVKYIESLEQRGDLTPLQQSILKGVKTDIENIENYRISHDPSLLEGGASPAVEFYRDKTELLNTIIGAARAVVESEKIAESLGNKRQDELELANNQLYSGEITAEEHEQQITAIGEKYDALNETWATNVAVAHGNYNTLIGKVEDSGVMEQVLGEMPSTIEELSGINKNIGQLQANIEGEKVNLDSINGQIDNYFKAYPDDAAGTNAPPSAEESEIDISNITPVDRPMPEAQTEFTEYDPVTNGVASDLGYSNIDPMSSGNNMNVPGGIGGIDLDIEPIENTTPPAVTNSHPSNSSTSNNSGSSGGVYSSGGLYGGAGSSGGSYGGAGSSGQSGGQTGPNGVTSSGNEISPAMETAMDMVDESGGSIIDSNGNVIYTAGDRNRSKDLKIHSGTQRSVDAFKTQEITLEEPIPISTLQGGGYVIEEFEVPNGPSEYFSIIPPGFDGATAPIEPMVVPENPAIPEQYEGVVYDSIEGELFVDGVSANDVKHGYAGDTTLTALLASLAEQNPQIIENMITDNGDGTYVVHFRGLGDVVVDGTTIPMLDGQAIFAQPTTNGEGRTEIWVAVIEKAYAQARGGVGTYQPVQKFSGDHINNMNQVVSDVLGDYDGGSYAMGKLAETTPEAFQAQVASGMPIIALADLTKSWSDQTWMYADGYVPGQSYAVIDTRMGEDGQLQVRLYNPWGRIEPGAGLVDENGTASDGRNDGAFWVSWDDFNKNFLAINRPVAS